MQEKLINTQVEYFLRDFEVNSETIILEEGSKEKVELEKIAEARGIKLKGSRDLAVLKTIYAFTDEPNANGAILPKKELLRVLPQIVGKPVNINHSRRDVIGNYIDYRYKQKEDKVIAYQTFFKSNFPEEFEEAKELLKKKKLSSSFEIWSPKDKRKYREDGSYEMYQMEIAGGALIYEDKDNQPAFKDAKVLSMAKENKESKVELVYASKHKEDELITSAGEIETITKTEPPITKAPAEVIVVPVVTKAKCENCDEEFEPTIMGEIKCTKCFAILDKTGKMIYPPQLIDFKMSCPGCHIRNWRLLKNTDEQGNIKCLHCSKEFKVTWAKVKVNELAQNMNFIYVDYSTCLQCGKVNEVVGSSKLKIKTVKCKRCGLKYSYDITRESHKQISNIEEIITVDKKETSEKGGNKMTDKKKVEKASEKKIETKEHDFLKGSEKENKKVISEKIEKAKVEKPEKEEAKAEVKPKEAKVEPKKEKVEKPKVEEAKEAPKAKEEVKTEKIEKPKVEEAKEQPKVKKAPKAEEKPVVEEAKDTKEQKYAKGIRKLASKIRELKKNMVKAEVENEKKITFYKDNAKEILSRRAEIKDYKISDEDILNDDKFAKAKLELENASIRATLEKGDDVVGSKKKDAGYYKDLHDKIDKDAFGHKDEK